MDDKISPLKMAILPKTVQIQSITIKIATSVFTELRKHTRILIDKASLSTRGK